MGSNRLLFFYRVGKTAFALGLLLFLIFSTTKIGNFLFITAVLTIYLFITSYLTFLKKGSSALEFLLDETLIFSLVKFHLFNYNFLAIFLIIPVFFSSLLLGKLEGLVCFFLGSLFHLLKLQDSEEEITLIQVTLNLIALVTMFIAGSKLQDRIKSQTEYIKTLEKEREIAKTYKKLYEISANMAHEIKNPLASIKGAIELLNEENRNREKLLKIIYSEVERLDRIVKDFLNLARPTSPIKTKLFLPEVFKEILQNLLPENKSYQLKIEPVYIEIDARGFYSTLENLLRNAFQWAKSKVVISCKKEGNSLKIIVEDDGPGINEEEKERIFEPFYSKNPKGSGLGLSIVHKFIVENKGRVKVEKSNLGGAKFVIIIPIKG